MFHMLALAASLLLSTLSATPLAQQATPPPPTQAAPAPQSTDPGVTARPPLPEAANPALPTLFLVGDSTVRNGDGTGKGGQWGWGEPLHDYFNQGKINVVNRALGGRSSRTYITEGRWQEVLDRLKPGDFILLQFGHNDSGPLDDAARARGTIKGVGDASQEIDNPITHKHETVHTYGWYMDEYVREGRAKGATVIVCSLIPRKIWDSPTHVHRNSGDDYGGWAREIADREHAPFIDLNEIIGSEYDHLGETAVEPLFADPHTHTSMAGARMNAEAVITGLKMLHPDPLAKYFSPAANEVPNHMEAAKS